MSDEQVERWWVIEESQLATALQRVAEGDAVGVVLMEFIANSDGEMVAEGQSPTCGECGGVVFWSCRTCDPVGRVIADRDGWNDHLANEVSIHILAVPSWLRRSYLRRVDRFRTDMSPAAAGRPLEDS